MEAKEPMNTGGQNNERNEIPKILKRYQNSDFGIQQRVIFFYRLCIAIIISLFLMMSYTSYVQIINPIYGKLFLPVLIPEFSIMVLTLISLVLLIKGHFWFSTQMLLATTLATVWVVMFLDKGGAVSRLDTVVFIYAILSALPLLVDKSKTAIIINISINIAILIVFILINKSQLNLDKSTVIDYISDFTISITFLGVVVYNISKINKRSFERAIQDIKERHEAEKALIESEKKYTETIDLLPQTIFEADLTGKLTYVNKVGFDVFGYTSDDLIKGVNVLSMITESDRGIASENIRNILMAIPEKGNQYTALRKDGSTFPVQIYSKVYETNGKPSGFRGIIIDITERNKAEEALRQSEMFRQRVFDSSNIPIVIMEPSSLKYIDINKAALDIYGFRSREDILGKVPIDVSAAVQYDGTPSAKKAIAYIIKAINEGSATFEWLHQRSNGEQWDAEVHLLPFKSNDQTLLQFSLIDITERKKAEKALKENEERYRSLIESLNEAIIVADNNHKVEYINKQFTELLGYTPEDIVGKIGYKILHDPEDLKIVENANVERINNVFSSYEIQFKAKGGRKFDILVSGSPLKNAEGEIIGSIGALTDITERKKVEKALKESQQLFQTLTQSSPVGIFRTRADGYTTFVNPKWSELSGLSFEEALGDGWLNAVHPDDRKTIKKIWEADSNVGSTSIAEYRFLKPDGSIVWVLGDAIPEIIDGEIKGFIGTITDITEIKTTLGLLETSEKRFRELSDLLPQPIWEADSSGRVTYINNHGMELYGYNQKEFEQGISLISTIIPEQRERAAFNIQERLSGKKVSAKDEEYISAKKNGEQFPVQVYVTAIKEKEKFVGLRGITVDMTEIKKASDALRQSEEKYRTLMESINEVVMMVDNDDRVQFVNNKFTEILGYTQEEIIGFIGYEKLLPPNEQLLIKKANNLRVARVSSQYEISFIAKNGKIIDFLVHGAPVENEKGEVIGSIGTMIDITEKKQIELELERHRTQLEFLVNERTEELAAANEELKATNEELYSQRKELEEALNNLKETQNKLIQSEKMASLGVLAAGIAHEINNPLNFINGGASGIESYINENFKDHIKDVAPLIEGIQIGVKRAADIVTSLNHYSRRDDLPSTKCDVNAIIDNCLVILHNQLKNRIEVDKNFNNKIYTLLCNEGRLHQVFLNILSNSIQAIDDKGTITIFTSIKKDYLTISISDTGCGISKENLPKITDPFFTTKEPGKGTGLGLSITYNIIKEYNGTLEFDSEIGVGTKAIITLPLNKEN